MHFIACGILFFIQGKLIGNNDFASSSYPPIGSSRVRYKEAERNHEHHPLGFATSPEECRFESDPHRRPSQTGIVDQHNFSTSPISGNFSHCNEQDDIKIQFKATLPSRLKRYDRKICVYVTQYSTTRKFLIQN